jgi:glycosyltransferase involved in cell wall biosynthesis
MTTPSFSLVIPCYNEAASLPELVERSRFVAQQGNGEVILVDNGSTDETPRILEELLPSTNGLVRSIRVEVNEGYGFGIVSGLRAALAPVIGWTHADLQTDPADVLRALPAFSELDGPIFVKGRRFGRAAGDRFFTAGMSVFETVLFQRPLSDIYGQPTLFHRELMDEWGEAPKDFALDLFATLNAKKRRYRIVRFPVIFAPRKYGTSSWNIDLAAKRKFIKRTVTYSLAMRRSE